MKEYYYLSTEANFCFDMLKEQCSEEQLDELEEELRRYNEDVMDDFDDTDERITNFIRFIYLGDTYWLECMKED